jgi:hypothetical protein
MDIAAALAATESDRPTSMTMRRKGRMARSPFCLARAPGGPGKTGNMTDATFSMCDNSYVATDLSFRPFPTRRIASGADPRPFVPPGQNPFARLLNHAAARDRFEGIVNLGKGVGAVQISLQQVFGQQAHRAHVVVLRAVRQGVFAHDLGAGFTFEARLLHGENLGVRQLVGGAG